MRKLYKNKEFLIQKYVHEKSSMNELAKICECGQTTIYTWMKKYNISREINLNYKNKKFLIQKYIREKLSPTEVAKICECGISTIRNWIIKYNIPRRSISEVKKGKKRHYMTGKNNPAWTGGKIKNHGYIYIFSPDHPFRSKNGYVGEHRLVAEESLRKYCKNHPGLIEIDGVLYLKPDWIPHHRDDARDNNVWSNLFVMPKSSHNRFHMQGSKHPMYGKHLSDDTRRKISLYNQLQSSTSENNTLISQWGF